MMKTPLIFFLVVASLAQGQDFFVKRFAYNQAMANCIGEEKYYGWMLRVTIAKHQCYFEPIEMPSKPVVQKQEEMVSDLVKREFLYDGPVLEHLLTKAVSKTGNFTCLMQKMNYVNENLTLISENVKNDLRNLTTCETLRAQLVDAVDQCDQFSMCAPEGGSPMPIEIKRLLAFMRGEREQRMAICMKRNILRIMPLFDTSVLPFETADQDEMAEKILNVLWGSEANEDFEIY